MPGRTRGLPSSHPPLETFAVPTKKTASPKKKSSASKTSSSKTSSAKRKAPAKKNAAGAKRSPKAAASKASKKKAADPAEEVVTIDRRRENADGSEPTPPATGERRQKVQRRRQIDPTTCERDYSEQEVEFMNAMDEYKRKSGRMFPTCSEVLEVIRDLGYVKLSPAEQAAAAATGETDVDASFASGEYNPASDDEAVADETEALPEEAAAF